MLKKKKGLTLIELLAVIAIIAILFVLLIPQINSAIDKARVAGVQTDYRSYQLALQAYEMENENLPQSEEDLNKYLDKNLQFNENIAEEENPWGDKYQLLITDKNVVISSEGSGKEYTLLLNEQGEVKTSFEEEIIIEGNYISQPTQGSIFAERKENETYFYLENKNYITITGYKSTNTVVNIPEQINNKPVKVIGSSAFLAKNIHPTHPMQPYEGANVRITEVTIPVTVEIIQNDAFNSSNLQNVVLPSSIKKIGHQAFIRNEMKTIQFNGDIEEIGWGPFFLNPDLTFESTVAQSKYKIGQDGESMYADNGTKIIAGTRDSLLTEEFKNVKVIGKYTFYSQQVMELTLHENIEVIEEAAFEGNGIATLILPSTIKTIEKHAFKTNPYLESVVNKTNISNDYLLNQVFINPKQGMTITN